MLAVAVAVAKVFQFNRIELTYIKRFHFMEPFLRFKKFVFLRLAVHVFPQIKQIEAQIIAGLC